jgi:hypothetical protein
MGAIASDRLTVAVEKSGKFNFVQCKQLQKYFFVDLFI